MNEWNIFICFLSFIERRKMTRISCFICNILYSSTGVMRASNPSQSCREEASNTPATSTQEEKHPQSLPRGRKNERLHRMDLPRNWMSLQEEVQEPSIKRRLDVNQRRRSISVQLYQLVRRGGSKSGHTPQYWGPLCSCTVTGRNYDFIGGGDKLTRDPEENEQEGEDKMTW